MNKFSIPGFIHAKPASDWESGPEVIDGHRMIFFTTNDVSDMGYILVGSAVVEFEMPEGWDPRAQQIDALETKKAQLRRQFAKEMMDIDTAISRLQAIEHTA